jgi:hypothetical protein
MPSYMENLFIRIEAARPDPLFLNADEKGLLLAYVKTLPHLAGAITNDLEEKIKWRKHLRFVVECNQSLQSGAQISAGSPTAMEETKGPRLTVDLAQKTITLDGVRHEISSDLALRWIKVLDQSPGHWISSTELKNHDPELDGARPDKFKRYLPAAILSLISTDRRKGARLRLS